MSNHPNDPAFEEPVQSTDEASFGDILSQFEQEQQEQAETGQPLEGTVVAVHENSVFVDIGRKTEGVVPVASLKDEKGEVPVKVGDKLLVNVRGRNEEGYYELSTVRVERPKDWSGLQAAFAEGRTIGGVVQEVIKGGLRVDIGARAFMPASRSGARDVAEMEKLVGQEIRCRITKLDVEKEDVVVDRRVVLEEEERERKEAAFAGISEGQVIKGVVKTLMDFGAFIDLGGVDGLLHVADISWTRINKPADVLKVGDEAEVKVLKVNRDTRKISLGMKQLQPDPWSVAAEQFKPGDRVRGTVARIADFGAFVSLAPGVDGMIHVGDITREKRIDHPKDVVKAGQTVRAQVLEFDKDRRRIRLGMKQLEPTSSDLWIAEHQQGETITGRIVDVKNDRAKVEVGEGVFAVCRLGTGEHKSEGKAGGDRSDISAMTAMLAARWKSGPDFEAEQKTVKSGQVRQFRIVSLDPQSKRIELETVTP